MHSSLFLYLAMALLAAGFTALALAALSEDHENLMINNVLIPDALLGTR
jgi:hypothetical protein